MTGITFCLVAPDGTVLRRCRAVDASDARTTLRPTPDQCVVSQASLDAAPVRAVGVAVAPSDPLHLRPCNGCGKEPRVGGYSVGSRCLALRRRTDNGQRVTTADGRRVRRSA